MEVNEDLFQLNWKMAEGEGGEEEGGDKSRIKSESCKAGSR